MELNPFSYYFYDIKDTESELCEITIGVAGPIFTHKKIPKALWDNYIHTLLDWRKMLWQFFIFVELELFSYFFVITKTLNLGGVK